MLIGACSSFYWISFPPAPPSLRSKWEQWIGREIGAGTWGFFSPTVAIPFPLLGILGTWLSQSWAWVGHGLMNFHVMEMHWNFECVCSKERVESAAIRSLRNMVHVGTLVVLELVLCIFLRVPLQQPCVTLLWSSSWKTDTQRVTSKIRKKSKAIGSSHMQCKWGGRSMLGIAEQLYWWCPQ